MAGSTCLEHLQPGGAPPVKPATRPWDRAPVVLKRGHCFEGLLAFSGAARVDGELNGEVVCRGILLLGEGARVRARIEVDEVIVAGEFEGHITARRRIELLPTARVRGHLEAPRVALADGCVVHGRCTAGASSGAASGPAQAPGKTSPASA